MFRKSSLRYDSWTVTLSLAAAGILYLVCSFWPTSRALQALRDEIREHKTYIADATSLTSVIAQSQTQRDRSWEYAANWRQRLPTPATFSALLGRITRQADLAGAETTRIEPQPAIELATMRAVPILFSAKGNFGQVSHLLAGLERLPERIWLEDVRLEQARESRQRIKVDLRLVVFTGNSDISD
jgi:Tfp pilus assembly protein PilO